MKMDIRAPKYTEPFQDTEYLGAPSFTHLASVGRVERYWLDDSLSPRETQQIDDEVVIPVVSVRDDRMRVVVEDDSARVAIWIESKFVHQTVVGKVKIEDSQLNRNSAIGLWLKPGARLRNLDYNQDLVRVEIFEDGVRATGWIPRSFIGRFWEISPDPTPVATRLLRPHSSMLDQAISNAAVVAVSNRQLPVTIARSYGDWSEVEMETKRLHARGFVTTTALDANPPSIVAPAPSSFIQGMPAGVCLFAGITNEVVGVTTTGAMNARRVGGWWSVYVNSPFGKIEVLARDRSKGKGQPDWVMCPRSMKNVN